MADSEGTFINNAYLPGLRVHVVLCSLLWCSYQRVSFFGRSGWNDSSLTGSIEKVRYVL